MARSSARQISRSARGFGGGLVVAWSYPGAALLAEGGHANESIPCFRSAIRVRPEIAELHSNLAAALARAGNVPEAIAEHREAIRLDPDSAAAHSTPASATCCAEPPNNEDRLRQLEQAVDIDPQSAQAQS